MSFYTRRIYELHDAKISKIEVTNNRTALIEFEHIAVHYEISDNKYDIWSNNFVIILIGVNSIEMIGSFDKGDYISDGNIKTRDNKELVMFGLNELLNSNKIELMYSNGCTVTISYNGSKLIKESRIEKIEEWDGPL
ncbi:MAG: hypothetical protein Q8940_21965 [Bacteroidota bacterium]|nr:hypothetical protein [Bacteroidota bacterium]